jgi:glycosyltransferase involved in cell wall biosynthesis
MEKDLPRVLLISQVSLSERATGINRTLFNLFEDYPSDRFMLYAPDQILKNDPTSSIFQKNIARFPEQFFLFPYQRNRLGFLFNPLFTILNHQLIDWLPLASYQKIADFSPEVILICPNGSLSLLMGYKLIQYFDVPFLIYFMDDWVALNHLRWLTGNVQSICQFILQKAAGWLMISPQLEQELAERYKIKPQRSLIVHNPVDLSNKTLPDFTPLSRDNFRVVYAGAIWPMHYDAVAVVAEAIYELRRDGIDIELVLHTPVHFWNAYQENWEKWQVTYGNLIPYQELNQYLQKADLLLVASSFLPEHSHVTRCSVQTKLTDYMASGRPILACGPNYSACNQFVKNWNCGLVCETNLVSEIKEILLTQIQNVGELYFFAKNGFEVLKDNFESKKVRYKLYEFIQQQSLRIYS